MSDNEPPEKPNLLNPFAVKWSDRMEQILARRRVKEALDKAKEGRQEGIIDLLGMTSQKDTGQDAKEAIESLENPLKLLLQVEYATMASRVAEAAKRYIELFPDEINNLDNVMLISKQLVRAHQHMVRINELMDSMPRTSTTRDYQSTKAEYDKVSGIYGDILKAIGMPALEKLVDSVRGVAELYASNVENHGNSPGLLATSGLKALGDMAVLPCGRLLEEDTDRNVRLVSAAALGEIGDKRAIPALLATLDDKDEKLVNSAVLALMALRATEALPRLISLSKEHKNGLVGRTADNAVKVIPSPDRVAMLLEEIPDDYPANPAEAHHFAPSKAIFLELQFENAGDMETFESMEKAFEGGIAKARERIPGPRFFEFCIEIARLQMKISAKKKSLSDGSGLVLDGAPKPPKGNRKKMWQAARGRLCNLFS